MDIERRRTNCRCCGALCGVVLDVRGDDVVAVRGDDDHPLSHGYLCPKGRALPAFHAHLDRIEAPRLHGREVGWGACLDDLAATLTALVDEHGPDSVGWYASNGQFFDSSAIFAENRFFGELGSRQHYTASTVDIAPMFRAAELVTGFAKEIHPLWDPDASAPSLVLMLGINSVVSHTYYGAQMPDPIRRIRQFRARGGEVWVTDPRRSETAALADRHLALRPGTDALVLAWLVRELLVDGADRDELASACDPDDVERLRRAVAPFGLDVVVARTGLEPGDLTDLLAAIRRHRRLAAVSGTGITFGRFGLVTEWLRWALLIVTGSLDRPGGMNFNPGTAMQFEAMDWSRPAPAAGSAGPGPASRPELMYWADEMPCVALVDEIEAGTLKALFVSGGSPITAFPDPDRTAAALARLPVLAVIDVMENVHTRMATHVLPVAGQLERGDVLYFGTRNMYAPPVVPPVADRKPCWWVYGQLGRRMGYDVLLGHDVDACTDDDVTRIVAGGARGGPDAFLAAGSHGMVSPDLHGWVHEHVLPGGRWRIAPEVAVARLAALLEAEPVALTLINRRDVHNHNSVLYAQPVGGVTPAEVHMTAADAAARAIGEGSRVRVATSSGEMVGVVHLDGRARDGVISINHGWLEPNVNRLVDRIGGVDPMTSMPTMSGIPVTVELVPSEVGEVGEVVEAV